MAMIALTIPDELLATYQRFQQENGAQWADAFVIDKLRELAQRQTDVDARDVYAKLKLLTPADRAAILAEIDAKKPK